MATGIKDSQLPDAAALDGAELLALVQEAQNRKVPLAALRTFILSGVDEMPLASFSVAALPEAAASEGRLVHVADGAAGAPCLAYCDGAAWLRVALGTPVSAS